jgi:hypothetical protein
MEPGTDAVTVKRVVPGKPARIEIEVSRGAERHIETVVWANDTFTTLRPHLPLDEDGRGVLTAIENRLFDRHDYAHSLSELTSYVSHQRSKMPKSNNRDLLILEARYHTATCLHKLGQTESAADELAALVRDDPKGDWGKLAIQWLPEAHGAN